MMKGKTGGWTGVPLVQFEGPLSPKRHKKNATLSIQVTHVSSTVWARNDLHSEGLWSWKGSGGHKRALLQQTPLEKHLGRSVHWGVLLNVLYLYV